MDRRTFLGTLTGGLLAAPLAAEAQQSGKVPRIGVLVPVEPESATEPNVKAFRLALRNLGYFEAQNVVVAYRYAHGQKELYTKIAADLVDQKVDIMVVGATLPVMAAKEATRTIPIIGVGMGYDPVASGIVKTLARPGGNVTGSAWASGNEFAGKQVELLKEAAPGIVRVGFLMDSRYRLDPRALKLQTDTVQAARAAAHAAGLTFEVLEVAEPREAEGKLAKLAKDRRGSLVVLPSLFFMVHAREIVNLADKHRLPTMYNLQVFMDAGGLMSYGPSLADLWARAADYVDKILKGAKPGDLPVEQPTKYELVINLKTAKALGLTIPPSLLARADQVIE